MKQNENEAFALDDQPPPHEAPVGAAVGVRPKRTIVDITHFKGRPDEDVLEWLVRWEVAASATGWTEEHQLIVLPAYLGERAARWYWRTPAGIRQNLDAVKDAAEDTFNTEENKLLARQELQEIYQKPRETVELRSWSTRDMEILIMPNEEIKLHERHLLKD